METTKEKLMEEAAQHKADTVDKKVDVAKAEVTEEVDSVKIGAADLAEKAGDKLDEAKDTLKGAWEATKDKAEEIGDKIADKAHDLKESVNNKMD